MESLLTEDEIAIRYAFLFIHAYSGTHFCCSDTARAYCQARS